MSDSQRSEAVPVIEIKSVSRRFGSHQALNDVNLTIRSGGVYGLIGGNGAGKTTLIKHIIGMLKAQQGTVNVFGLNPVEHPIETLGRIGYLSEDRDLPDWMTVGELLRYTQPFFPKWDHQFAAELCDAFDLDKRSVIKTVSRGQRARVGLLVAMAHRPDLLILDEPSSGLDPVVRRDILGAVIRTIADEGRTVLFSSHLLDEVERVSDQVALIHEGRILLTSSMEEIKESHLRMTLRFDQHYDSPPYLDGMLSGQGQGQEWTYVLSGQKADLRSAATSIGGTIVDEVALSLDEIFVSRVAKA